MKTRWPVGLSLSLLGALVVACGGNSGGGADATPADAPTPDANLNCGNGIVEVNEDCDDRNTSEDDLCLNNCTWACGDGVVNAVELCDTGVAANRRN